MPIRIHEISKKWGIKSVDLVDRLEELGVEVASHMSTVSDDDVKLLANSIVRHPIKPGKAGARKKAAAKKAAEKKAAEEKAAAEKAAVDKAAAEKEAADRETAEKKAAEEKAAAEARMAEEQKVRESASLKVQTPEPAPSTKDGEVAREATPPAAEDKAPGEVVKPAEPAKPAPRPVHGKKPAAPVEKIAVVDEDALKEQMVKAAAIVEKESKEESRILRRIILPPRKKAKKKQKFPVGRGPAVRAIVAPSKPTKVELQAPVSLRDFSQATGIKTGQLVKKLMDLGTMASVNQPIPDEMVEVLAMEFGVEATVRKEYDPDDELRRLEEQVSDPAKLMPRPPVVTLLGHVDHGKTSLLDAIRHSDVAAGEFGGITQHVGAYRVKTDSGHIITFLDTPGHEAFTEMRARGANVTDIVILVVAADDGVMPQTVEAVNHAKAAKVPIVVAVNKIDKPDAQIERVKRQLTTYELLAEEWGGETIFAPVSAITKDGVDNLLEMLALQAELLELSADPSRPALGTVIEARRTEGKGIVVTVLVQNGTLKLGDVMVAGGAYGKLRIMNDERGRSVDAALPSTPVEVSGFNEVPEAGDKFYVLDDLQKAREIAERRLAQRRQQSIVSRPHVSLENLMESFESTGTKELKLILKADVQGSVEVLQRTLADMSIPEVAVRVIHAGVGGINESDVLLADASDAIVLGFNVVAEQAARSVADQKKVEIRLYNVIYHLMEDMRAALENRLEPEIREVIRGQAEVRDTFKVSRIGTIAGCMVTNGVIPRRATIRVARQGVVVHEGQIDSLKHFKDDVREVREGFECGIKLAGFDDVKNGDVFEAFETEKIARKLA